MLVGPVLGWLVWTEAIGALLVCRVWRRAVLAQPRLIDLRLLDTPDERSCPWLAYVANARATTGVSGGGLLQQAPSLALLNMVVGLRRIRLKSIDLTRCVDFGAAGAGAALAALLARCTHLESLALPSAAASSEEYDGRSRMCLTGSFPSSRGVCWNTTPVFPFSDADVLTLVRGCPRLSCLRNLQAGSAHLTAVATTHLARHCPALRILHDVPLWFDGSVGDVVDANAAIARLARGCPLLESLRFDEGSCAYHHACLDLRPLRGGGGGGGDGGGCRLRELEFYNGSVGDGDLADKDDIAGFETLETLTVRGQSPNLGDRGLVPFVRGSPRLAALRLQGTAVGDGTLAALGECCCARLTVLQLRDAPAVGPLGLEAVARGCPQLRELVLAGVDYDAGLAAFHVSAQLRRLELGRGSAHAQQPDDGVMAIARAGGGKLEHFKCWSTQLSDVALLLVVAATPALLSVDVAGCARLTNVVCQPLFELRQLEQLRVADCAQVSAAAMQLAQRRAAGVARAGKLRVRFEPWDAADEGDENPWPPGVGEGW
jgi:hypothetical protein